MFRRLRVNVLFMVSMLLLPVYGTPASAQSGSTTLKLAHLTSGIDPVDRFILRPWTEKILKLSGGTLKIAIYPAGELGRGAGQQYERAARGTADITFGLQGATESAFPGTLLIELPGIAPDSVTATQMLWKAFDLIRDEYKDTRLLGLWTNHRAVLINRKKPLGNVADVRGLKIFTLTRVQREVVSALGATPSSPPEYRMFRALDGDAVDALMVSPISIMSYDLGKIAKYYTVGPFPTSAFFLAMNKRAYDRLSSEHQKLIDQTTGKPLSFKAADLYKKASDFSLREEEQSGRGSVLRLTGPEEKKWLEALSHVRKDTMQRLSDQGVPVEKILSAMGVAR